MAKSESVLNFQVFQDVYMKAHKKKILTQFLFNTEFCMVKKSGNETQENLIFLVNFQMNKNFFAMPETRKKFFFTILV